MDWKRSNNYTITLSPANMEVHPVWIVLLWLLQFLLGRAVHTAFAPNKAERKKMSTVIGTSTDALSKLENESIEYVNNQEGGCTYVWLGQAQTHSGHGTKWVLFLAVEFKQKPTNNKQKACDPLGLWIQLGPWCSRPSPPNKKSRKGSQPTGALTFCCRVPSSFC